MDKWVAQNGDNNNPGTQQLPWLTIQYGVDELQKTGGTLHVVAGPVPYKENITMMQTSGTDDYNNIIIKGESIPGFVTTVDGGGKAKKLRVFTIEGPKGVQLRGLTIQNGDISEKFNTISRMGGGVLVWNSQTDLIGCTFKDNLAVSGAGFTYSGANKGKSMVMECTMINNQALAIDAGLGYHTGGSGGGGAVINSDQVEIRSSHFETNIADLTGGGGLYIERSENITVIDNCMFKDNKATIGPASQKLAPLWEVSRGGGIYITDCRKVPVNIKITQNNTFDSNKSELFGGAICIDNYSVVEITNKNQFLQNIAHHEGGGIAIIQQNAFDFGVGAVLDIVQEKKSGHLIYIEDNTFEKNFAYDGGGAVYATASSALTLVKNQILQNSTIGGPGAGVHVSWNCFLEMRSNTVKGCVAQGDGGGLYARNSHVTITEQNIFQENRAQWGLGGGIYIVTQREPGPFGFVARMYEEYLQKAGFTTANITIESQNQFLTNNGMRGGGMYIEASPPVYIPLINIQLSLSENDFVDNTGANGGGACYLIKCDDASIINNAAKGFLENKSDHYGAALLFEACVVDVTKITGNTFKGNTFTRLNPNEGQDFRLKNCNHKKLSDNEIKKKLCAANAGVVLTTISIDP